ncbi:MAG: hypothetical protein AAFY88_31785, partial [Acidobacteriota bacterium]
GSTLATVPAEVPYLRPPSGAAEGRLLSLIRASTHLRVGLVWKSGTLAPRHASRDLGREEVELLLAVPGISWFPLQYGEKLSDLLGPTAERRVVADLGPVIGDFAATAAVVTELDLLITVDTAALHLAGALGQPVWALIPEPGDWRWMADQDRSPWYPTLSLFRQPRRDDWREPLSRLVDLLALEAAAGRGRR